jgi:uncharacterized protein (DUF1778 family)
MSSLVAKDERIALRVTPHQKLLVARAAQARGETLTEFSVSTLVERAERVLADQSRLILTAEQWDEFSAALDQPARVLPELREFMRQPSVFE